jgi:hypothetical protein
VLIGNHPELKHWRPHNGVAYPAPFPCAVDLARSVIKDLNCIPPSGIKFLLEHENGQCRVVKQFKDVEFARVLLRQRDKCIGLRLSVLEFVDIDYSRVPVIWFDGIWSVKKWQSDGQACVLTIGSVVNAAVAARRRIAS